MIPWGTNRTRMIAATTKRRSVRSENIGKKYS